MDYISKIQAKYPYLKKADIEDMVECAKEILLNTLYPFDDAKTDIPKRRETWIYRAVLEMIERNGMTSAINYKEGAIQIQFDRAQISQALLDELVPECGAF